MISSEEVHVDVSTCGQDPYAIVYRNLYRVTTEYHIIVSSPLRPMISQIYIDEITVVRGNVSCINLSLRATLLIYNKMRILLLLSIHTVHTTDMCSKYETT